jgi:HSP20 family molecular chaperone IbpA
VPADVDIDAIRAGLAEGVLTVTLPRRVDQPARKVDIDQ